MGMYIKMCVCVCDGGQKTRDKKTFGIIKANFHFRQQDAFKENEYFPTIITNENNNNNNNENDNEDDGLYNDNCYTRLSKQQQTDYES